MKRKRKTRSNTKLRRMRISRGLLQIELSELTGINQSTLCEMERRGVRRVDKALDIAKALQCTVDEILDDPKPKESRASRA